MSVVAPISATAAVIPVPRESSLAQRPSGVPGRRDRARARRRRARVAREPSDGAGAESRKGSASRWSPPSVRPAPGPLGAASDADALWATLAMRTTSFTPACPRSAHVRPTLAVGRDNLPVLLLIACSTRPATRSSPWRTNREPLSVAAVLAQLYPWSPSSSRAWCSESGSRVLSRWAS